MQRIKEAAERAKHDLSAAEVTDINLPFIASNESGPKHLTTRIARGQFESMASVLVERSLQPCRQALADAQLKPADIDEILMVGGMTRMPLVQSKVSEFSTRNQMVRLILMKLWPSGQAFRALCFRRGLRCSSS